MSFAADYKAGSLGKVLTPAQNSCAVNGATCVIKNQPTR